MKNISVLLINPNEKTITKETLDISKQDGLKELQKLMGCTLFEVAPKHPQTGDMLIVADTFAEPQPEAKRFAVPFVRGGNPRKGRSG